MLVLPWWVCQQNPSHHGPGSESLMWVTTRCLPQTPPPPFPLSWFYGSTSVLCPRKGRPSNTSVKLRGSWKVLWRATSKDSATPSRMEHDFTVRPGPEMCFWPHIRVIKTVLYIKTDTWMTYHKKNSSFLGDCCSSSGVISKSNHIWYELALGSIAFGHGAK